MLSHNILVRVNRSFQVTVLFGSLCGLIQLQGGLANFFLPGGNKLCFFARLKDYLRSARFTQNESGRCKK